MKTVNSVVLFKMIGMSQYSRFIWQCNKRLVEHDLKLAEYVETNPTTGYNEYALPIDVAILVIDGIRQSNPNKAKTLEYLYKEAGLQIAIRGFNTKEKRFMEELSAALAELGVQLRTQKYVDGYRIDGYIEEYKLAIEFDETYHKYQSAKDQNREHTIKESLDCKFVRIREEESIGTSIGKVIAALRNS